jgi:predicted small metal-binding protein
MTKVLHCDDLMPGCTFEACGHSVENHAADGLMGVIWTL